VYFWSLIKLPNCQVRQILREKFKNPGVLCDLAVKPDFDLLQSALLLN